MENNDYQRNKLLTTLLQIGHNKDERQKGQKLAKKKIRQQANLSLYIDQGLLAAEREPELFAKLIVWNAINGKVRDSQVAFPALLLRKLTSTDRDLAESAVASVFKALAVRDVVRWRDFHALLGGQLGPLAPGIGLTVKRGLSLYLDNLERSQDHWERTTLQHRAVVKRLYKIVHRKPRHSVQNILFGERDIITGKRGKIRYPGRSKFADVARLRDLSPAEAASIILTRNIPLEVAIGSVSKAKDPQIVHALIEGMTISQLLVNAKFLEKLGVRKDPVLKAAFEAALERGKKSQKGDALKAGRAAEALEDEDMKAQLLAVQAAKTRQLGGIDGDWLILGDASLSMQASIDLARKVAGLLTERVTGAVHLVFFHTQPTYIEVTGLSYAEILEKTRRIKADGNTSIGVGLDYIGSKGLLVQGIAIISDGGENQPPFFAPTYQKYAEKYGLEPTIYLFHVPGDADKLTVNCQAAGIQGNKFELNAHVDEYSLQNVVGMMKTAVNRYGLLEEIMAQELLTFEQVFRKREGTYVD